MRDDFFVKKLFYSNTVLKKIWTFTGRLYEHVTAPTGALRSFVLFPIMGFCRVHKILGFHKPYDRIELLKNKHIGKRCFIVATGPSLLMSDLELLKDEITISMNSIFKCYDKTDWRPNYYMNGDFTNLKSVIGQNDVNVDSLARNYELFSTPCKKYIKTGNKTILFNVNWLDHWYKSKSDLFRYNDNLLFGFYDFYTIAISCIQLAMYMGIKEIYLIGTDCDFSGSKWHVYDQEEVELSKAESDAAGRDVLKGYAAMKKLADERGVKIYNVTRGGKLEIFPRLDFDSIITR